MTALRIHCWRNEYRVPAALVAGSAAAHDLDRLSQRLAEAFAAHAGTMPGLGDGAVVLLRELAVDCDIDITCPADQVVRHWSRGIAAAFARALDEGRALRFASQAAFHARFITDLLHGRAWDSWMYGRFDGLRVLPAGAVIRTLLTRDVADACETLALVDVTAWPLLLGALPPREAVRILDAWHGAAGMHTTGHEAHARIAAWLSTHPGLPGAYAPPLVALWLLAAWQRDGHAGPVAMACWIAALLALPAGLTVAQLRRLARRADGAALRVLSHACDDADWLRLLATSPAAERQAALRVAIALRTAETATTGAAPAQMADPVDAPCAGLAWLLPALLQLVEGPLAGALPPCSGSGLARGIDCTPADLATLCALALAAGPRGAGAWRDPFWRAFLAVPGNVTAESLHGWLAPHEPAAAAIALARAIAAQAMGAPVCLRYEAGGSAGKRLLAVERGSGCPLGAASGSGVTLPLPERLALTRLARHDAAWLAMSPLPAWLPAPWRELFATLALAALRRTANRIPGAARGSLPWLFTNVFGMGGSAQPPAAAGEAWLLEPARPPLHVLLSLNGMARLRLDWPGGRRLAVQCAE